jgi:hypothetical protein
MEYMMNKNTNIKKMKKINLTSQSIAEYPVLSHEDTEHILEIRKDIEFNYIKVMKIRSPQTFRMDMHKAAEHTTKHLVDLGVTEAVIGLRGLVYTTILADKLFKSHIMPIYLDEVTVSSVRIR